MKILIVPDVHGRDFWRIPCLVHHDEFDKIIFLGDYLDHYPGESTKQHDIDTLRHIILFKKTYLDKVILLIGNHDCPYIWPDTYGKALGNYWCRHDDTNHNEIHDIFIENLDLFQIAWDCPYKDTKVLFTHAGVNQGFKDICGLDAEQINTFFLKEKSGNVPNVVGLTSCSFYRGGYAQWGSPVWADIREHFNEPITDVYQIFGHTYAEDVIQYSNFIMTDIGKTCWTFDTEGEFKVEKYV